MSCTVCTKELCTTQNLEDVEFALFSVLDPYEEFVCALRYYSVQIPRSL